MANTNKSGSFQGKSNALGHGGRAAQLKAQGVPGGVIGAIARKKGAAPGQANFHGSKPNVKKSAANISANLARKNKSKTQVGF
jgi:hypothetical protein